MFLKSDEKMKIFRMHGARGISLILRRGFTGQNEVWMKNFGTEIKNQPSQRQRFFLNRFRTVGRSCPVHRSDPITTIYRIMRHLINPKISRSVEKYRFEEARPRTDMLKFINLRFLYFR